MSGYLLWIAVGVTTVAAVLLVLRAPNRRSSRGGLRLPGVAVLLELVRRWGQDARGETRHEATMLLRQFSALLQSGRGEAQAWGDLRDHWSRRSPGHPFARVCAQIAAASQVGVGVSAGMRSASAQLGDSVQEWETIRLLDQLTSITALSEQTGAPLSRLVEQVAVAMDDAAELHAAVRTAAAGPRLTQLLLAVLPLGGLVLGGAMGVDVLGVLFGSGLGLLAAGIGLSLLGAGHWWSSRMIASVMRHV